MTTFLWFIVFVASTYYGFFYEPKCKRCGLKRSEHVVRPFPEYLSCPEPWTSSDPLALELAKRFK